MRCLPFSLIYSEELKQDKGCKGSKYNGKKKRRVKLRKRRVKLKKRIEKPKRRREKLKKKLSKTLGCLRDPSKISLFS